MIDGFTIIVFIVLCVILYYIIRFAVEDAMLSALKRYDNEKQKNNGVEEYK